MIKRHPRITLIIISIVLLWIFAFTPAETYGYIGDILADGRIDAQDLALIAQSFGARGSPPSPNWNPATDLDQDGTVDVADLAIAGRSYGLNEAFHDPRQPSNTAGLVTSIDTCMDGRDQLHIAWVEDSSKVFYTRLDRFGNTLVDDVLVDSGSGVGSNGVGIGCGHDGSAHLLWNCHENSNSRTCQARFDAWGYPVIKRAYLDTRGLDPSNYMALSIDSQSQTHALYKVSQKQVYALILSDGSVAFRTEDPQLFDVISSPHRDLKVDSRGNAHMIWTEVDGTDRILYARLGPDGYLAPRVIGLLDWGTSVNRSAQRPTLTVDSQNNAYILWNTYGSSTPGIYLDKIDTSGNEVINDEPVNTDWEFSYSTTMAMDSADRLHLMAHPTWPNSGSLHVGTGILDTSGNYIEPMRWTIYGGLIQLPSLETDSQNRLQLVYRPGPAGAGYPRCPSDILCYQGTAYDEAAYDRSRSDLGVDYAHLTWSPEVLRWNQSADVTVEVFNAGWADSAPSHITFDLMLENGDRLGGSARADLPLAAISPGQRVPVTAHLTLPPIPPAGYESINYLRLVVNVDPDHTLVETTLANNSIDPPLMVQPLPTTAGLFLIIKDITPTAWNGEAIPLNLGQAHLTGPGIDRTLDITDFTTVLANDLPISSIPITYNVSWKNADYRATDSAAVTISRNAVDPYQINYNPSNTITIEANRWSSLSGTITADGKPLDGVHIRIAGEHTSFEVVTGDDGQFSPTLLATLARLAPGNYQIRASRNSYARLKEYLTLPPLSDLTWNKEMVRTEFAYVNGQVLNAYNHPVSGAIVQACTTMAVTDNLGRFDLGEVDASCTQLTVDHSGYAQGVESLVLTAGLEWESEIILDFDPPLSVVSDEGSVGSWVQDETTSGLLPDPPEDANFFLKTIYDQFKDSFWPEYQIKVWWGTYEYRWGAAYTGSGGEYHLQNVQIQLNPTTFEGHLLQTSIEIDTSGGQVKFPLMVFDDSGVKTALWVVEARLVKGITGEVLKVVRNPIEGGSSWVALQQETRTYNFEGAQINDWANAEVWIYVKVGKNEDDQWASSPILRGYYFDQQILRWNLSTGEFKGCYAPGDFPSP